MSHTPWTQEQAEKWAHDMAIEKGWGSNAHEKHKIFESGFLAGLTKAAEMIEACETIRYTLRNGKPHTGSYELFEAYLVGVREIADSDERGSGR